MKFFNKIKKLLGMKSSLIVEQDETSDSPRFCFLLDKSFLRAKNLHTNENDVDVSYYFFLCSIKLIEEIEQWLMQQSINQYDLVLHLKSTKVTIRKNVQQELFRTFSANAEMQESDTYEMADVYIRFVNQEDALAFKMGWL